jgi:hypothetical protein
MSGGAFNYDQYKIGYIADEIEQMKLNKQLNLAVKKKLNVN